MANLRQEVYPINTIGAACSMYFFVIKLLLYAKVFV